MPVVNWEWITTSATAVWMVVLKAIAIYLILLLFTRMAGLRSFAKMSSFDFAITVAMGSLLAATTLTQDPPLVQSIVGLATLFALQYIVSWGRHKSSAFVHLIDNQPLLLMAGTQVIKKHLAEARISEADLKSKLRQAGVVNKNQVLAVVLETTGDISIFKNSDDAIDLDLFSNVKGKHHLVEM
ncbi:MAG: YetF domain-containing protein [Limnothrix sp.]